MLGVWKWEIVENIGMGNVVKIHFFVNFLCLNVKFSYAGTY